MSKDKIVIQLDLPDEFFKQMRELLGLPPETDSPKAQEKDKSASAASTPKETTS